MFYFQEDPNIDCYIIDENAYIVATSDMDGNGVSGKSAGVENGGRERGRVEGMREEGGGRKERDR